MLTLAEALSFIEAASESVTLAVNVMRLAVIAGDSSSELVVSPWTMALF